MVTLIFDVDTQNDFFNNSSNTDIVRSNINKCLIYALRNEMVISGTVKYRPESSPLDSHPCVFGTSGADKIDETILVDPTQFYTVPSTNHGIDLTLAESCWQIYFEKETPYIWSDKGQPDNLMSFLRFEEVTDIIVLGVNDMIFDSIQSTINGFIQNKFNITLITDAVSGMDSRLLDIDSVTYITTEEFLTQ